MTRGRVLVAAALAVFAALLLAASSTARGIKEGGTFRVALPAEETYFTSDPAFWQPWVFRPACGTLLDAPPKRFPAGLRFEPELAVDYPAVSKDGRTYTFTIRKDARFSNGAPVLARDVVHSLERILTLGPDRSFLAERLSDLVGAQAMFDGKATKLSGAVARGRTLILRLRKRVADFPVRASVCVVPASLPVDPEGAKAPIPSPAPYYVAEHIPNVRFVLERNRFYQGARPHHPTRFVVELGLDERTIIERIKSGDIDFTRLDTPAWAPFVRELAQQYGVNRSQFFSVPAGQLRMFVLNTSRPLFRKNPKLRQAVNFAVDRRALMREFGPAGGILTDQYMAPIWPGYRNEKIYPLKGPDLKKARELAKGRTRSGKAVLYTCPNPTCVAQSQILERNLEAIGLDVETVQFGLLFQKLATPGEPFDIGWFGFIAGDGEWVGQLFDGRTIGKPENVNFSYFDSPTYNRLIAAAAALPLGRARERAYGELDVRLSRDAAPGIPYGVSNDLSFVSAKVGCIVLNPSVDITAVCLKRLP
jgi:oligopeptide transport system substrate-binding protein